jgi:hypothetical protein
MLIASKESHESHYKLGNGVALTLLGQDLLMAHPPHIPGTPPSAGGGSPVSFLPAMQELLQRAHPQSQSYCAPRCGCQPSTLGCALNACWDLESDPSRDAQAFFTSGNTRSKQGRSPWVCGDSDPYNKPREGTEATVSCPQFPNQKRPFSSLWREIHL